MTLKHNKRFWDGKWHQMVNMDNWLCLSIIPIDFPLQSIRRSLSIPPWSSSLFSIWIASLCTATLYQHSFYRGTAHTYKRDGRVKRNNDMSSLKLSDGCCITVYSEFNYKGQKQKFCKSTNWVGAAWDDRVSSFKLMLGECSFIICSLSASINARIIPKYCFIFL